MNIIDLRDVLKNVRWALIGGIATRAYMPERATLDVDILIHSDDAMNAAEELAGAGFTLQQRLLIPGSSWIASDGTILDVLERNDEWVIDALRQTQPDPQGLPTLTLPYLVLMKMQAGRAQDLADISRMLGAAGDSELAEVRRVISTYLPDATSDLEGLVHLGKLELGLKEKENDR